MDPTDPSDAVHFPKPTATGDAITFEFTEPEGIHGVYYWAEISKNLVDWAPVEDEGSEGLHRFVLTFSDHGPCAFLRIRMMLEEQ